MAGVEVIEVDNEEDGMRLDRWFKTHYPGLGFGALQKLLRSGQVRVDGGRVKSDTRLVTGQNVRVPPIKTDRSSDASMKMTAHSMRNIGDVEALRKMTLIEDDRLLVINKPPGLSVQGGSNVPRHVDGMLESLRNKKGEKPRLVHRLDRETSGVLMIAKTRSAARNLAESFRKRETKKTYWALVKGAPPKKDGTIKSWLLKVQTADGDRMEVARHGVKGADHAISNYRIIERAGQRMSWLELEPYTGRTHQLRVHTLQMGCPILGDPKYFDDDANWEFPGGMQKKLHLHARRLVIPHPSGGTVDVTAPMPQHMVQSWNLLGMDEAGGDTEI